MITFKRINQREFEKHHGENFVSIWLIDVVQKTREMFHWNFQVGQQAHSFLLGVST